MIKTIRLFDIKINICKKIIIIKIIKKKILVFSTLESVIFQIKDICF